MAVRSEKLRRDFANRAMTEGGTRRATSDNADVLGHPAILATDADYVSVGNNDNLQFEKPRSAEYDVALCP